MKDVWWVDVPQYQTLRNADGAWKNVATLATKEEAVKFIREHIGNCDDDGNVCLITNGATL